MMRSRALAIVLLCASSIAAQEYRIAYALAGKGIFVMNGRGGAITKLTDDKVALLTDGAWSPDAKQIAFFAIRQTDDDIAKTHNIPFHFPLYVMNADGSAQRRLIDVPIVPDIRWSPDGKSIVVRSSFESPPRDALYIIDVAAGTYRRLTPLGLYGSASWSPDGKRIAFAGRDEIDAINPDGTNLTRLSHLDMPQRNPQWSPDGKRIAFVADGWFVMDADGANKKRVSRFSGGRVTWSPDGARILSSGGGSAYVAAVDGTNGHGIGQGYGPIIDPVFSPDGKRVVWRTHERGKNLLRSSNPDGSDIRTIADFPGECSGFALSPLLR